MELLTPQLGLMVWNLIAFLILLFILKKFAWKPILQSLKQRESGIAESLDAAEKVRAEMAQLKSENEVLLAKAQEERANILKEARNTKDKIINEAREQAKIAAGKILTEAQAAIEEKKMAAITEVKNEVGKLVVDVSERVLRRELTDQRAQEQYIKELSSDIKLN